MNSLSHRSSLSSLREMKKIITQPLKKGNENGYIKI
jgi:hypothetical protein